MCTEHQAGYVVMFISEAYVTKSWPRLERRAALSRMSTEDCEFVLPVRFDDTPVPGLPEDTLYLNADDYTPAALAALIAEKLGVRPFAGKASDVPPPRMTSLTGEVVFDYSSHNGRYAIGSGELAFETKWSKASNKRIYVLKRPAFDKRCSRVPWSRNHFTGTPSSGVGLHLPAIERQL